MSICSFSIGENDVLLVRRFDRVKATYQHREARLGAHRGAL